MNCLPSTRREVRGVAPASLWLCVPLRAGLRLSLSCHCDWRAGTRVPISSSPRTGISAWGSPLPSQGRTQREWGALSERLVCLERFCFSVLTCRAGEDAKHLDPHAEPARLCPGGVPGLTSPAARTQQSHPVAGHGAGESALRRTPPACPGRIWRSPLGAGGACAGTMHETKFWVD